MSFALQIRHPTGGVSASDYWVGFIAENVMNSPEGPQSYYSPFEIAELRLGLKEERRQIGGFRFPVQLYLAQQYVPSGEYDRSIVTRFYVEINDVALAFSSPASLLKSVDLLFARREGTLDALGADVEFRLFRDGYESFDSFILHRGFRNERACVAHLLRLGPNGPEFNTAIAWRPARNFTDVPRYIQEQSSRTAARNSSKVLSIPAIDHLELLSSIALPLEQSESTSSPPSSTVSDDSTSNKDVAIVRNKSKQSRSLFPLPLVLLVGALGGGYYILAPSKSSSNAVADAQERAGSPAASSAPIVKSSPSIPSTPPPAPPSPIGGAGGIVNESPSIAAGTSDTSSINADRRASEPVLVQVAPGTPTTASEVDILALANSIRVPEDNYIVSRHDLYTFGFREQLDAVKAMLVSAGSLDKTGFDSNNDFIRRLKPTRSWLTGETARERREFNEKLELLINTAKRSDNKPMLTRAVDLSESFLLTHFGHSTAHLNLSIAHSALGNGKAALPPAFHAIVFNPDSANGWVALGVALAQSGDETGATRAFCVVLRKVKFSNKTVTYFDAVAKGDDLNYPSVTRAMKAAMSTACPKEQWMDDVQVVIK